MGRDFRSWEIITEESWLSSGAVRSSLASALTCTFVDRAAMGSVMWSGAAKRPALEPAAADALVRTTTTGVVMVSNPGSETTSVKLPAWGGSTWKVPSPPERKLPATAPLVSTRSTSAPGTMAPVGSATTPFTAGAESGGGEAGLDAKTAEGASKAKHRAKQQIIPISRTTANISTLYG